MLVFSISILALVASFNRKQLKWVSKRQRCGIISSIFQIMLSSVLLGLKSTFALLI